MVSLKKQFLSVVALVVLCCVPISRVDAQFVQQGNKLVGTGAVANPYVAEGSSVALSADGNTAIIGGFYDNNLLGAAWVFTRTGGVWSQQGGKFVGNDVTGNGNVGFGITASISADGNTAI